MNMRHDRTYRIYQPALTERTAQRLLAAPPTWRAWATAALWLVLAALLAGPVSAQDDAPGAGDVIVAPTPASDVKFVLDKPATQPAEAAATAATAAPTTAATTVPATVPATVPSAATGTTPVVAPRPTKTPGGPITLNFRDVPVRTVLEYISESAGLTVVEESRVSGTITVISMQPLNTDEAVSLLDSVLKTKGYAAIRMNKTLKIVSSEQAKKELIPVRIGNDPTKITPSDRVVTQIIPLRYITAAKLKTDLATLMPLSTDVSANEASNTLIITGTEAVIYRITQIISELDKHQSEVSTVRVFKLENATASSAATLIQSIFKDDSTSSASGRNAQGVGRQFSTGGPGGMSGPGGMIGPGGMSGLGGMSGQQGSTSSGTTTVKVTASADDRTNTLVVSAPPDVMKIIAVVIEDLDKTDDSNPQTVFIYHLQNADSSNMATVLNNIFGGTSSGSSRTSTGTSTGSSRTSSSSGSSSSSRSGSSSSSGSSGSSSSSGLSSSSSSRTGSTGTTGTTGSTRSSTGSGSSSSSASIYFVADTDTNALVVTAPAKEFDRIKAVIADLDRAVPQVLIKVLIAEVTHEDTLDLGVELADTNSYPTGNWSAGSDFGVAAETDGFMFTLTDTHFSAAIHAIAGVGKIDVLSRPYILTSDNQTATILVGQEVPYVSNTRTSDDGDTINTISREDIGIILEVTPHINPQGLVTMEVYPEISSISDSTVAISETLNAPIFTKRYADSKVAVRDGETIVIGGLMADQLNKTVDKVPFLGDLPLVGRLFQHETTTKTKTELLIFLTPHVAKRPADLKSMTESELKGVKVTPKAVAEGMFDEHMKGMERGASTLPADGPAVIEFVAPAATTTQPANKMKSGSRNNESK